MFELAFMRARCIFVCVWKKREGGREERDAKPRLTFLEEVLGETQQGVVAELELLFLVNDVLALLQHTLGQSPDVDHPASMQNLLHPSVDEQEGPRPADAAPATRDKQGRRLSMATLIVSTL